MADETYGALPANPAVGQRVRAQEPAHFAARRVEFKDPRAGNPTVRRYYLAPSVTKAAAGRGGSPLPSHEDRRPRRHQPPVSEAGGGGEDRLDRRRLVRGHEPRQRQHRRLRRRRPGRCARQGRAVYRPRHPRAARERRHGGGAGTRQEAVHRRVRLRVRQPGIARPALWQRPGARPDDPADQQLAGGDQQGHAGPDQTGCGQVSRHPQLRDRHLVPRPIRARKAPRLLRRPPQPPNGPEGGRHAQVRWSRVRGALLDDRTVGGRARRCRLHAQPQPSTGDENPRGKEPRRHRRVAGRGAQRAADRVALCLRRRQLPGSRTARRACRTSCRACSTKEPET